VKKFYRQIVLFLATSGAGWLIDFSVYTVLTQCLKLDVLYANMISGIPATAFVFLVSVRKIFTVNASGLSLKKKYFIYFVYQMALIFGISLLGQWLYGFAYAHGVKEIALVFHYLKIIIKICITPITMTINFFVMKFLTEKV